MAAQDPHTISPRKVPPHTAEPPGLGQQNPSAGSADPSSDLRGVEPATVVNQGELAEVVEIETYGKRNEKPPKAKNYKFRIDRDFFTVDHQVITGKELFDLAKKSPERWRMHQKLHGGQMQEVKVDDRIDLGEPGIERFVTMELSQGDGESVAEVIATPPETPPPPRRHFRLPEDDEGFLNTLGLRWETIKDGNLRWLLIHEYPLPSGYEQKSTTIAICIEGGYPPGRLDMAYFRPQLTRADHHPIKAISSKMIGGQTFQRWSRHYPWREGIDSLATHYLRIREWLEAEPKRGA